MQTPHFLAATLALSLAAAGTATAAPPTDPSYYNVGGPGLANSTMPLPRPAAPSGHTRAAVPMPPHGATVAMDPTLYGSAGPGAVGAWHPAAVVAAPGVIRAQPAAPVATDAALYNTADPGLLAGTSAVQAMPARPFFARTRTAQR